VLKKPLYPIKLPIQLNGKSANSWQRLASMFQSMKQFAPKSKGGSFCVLMIRKCAKKQKNYSAIIPSMYISISILCR
jgi:hypothetical protein